MRAMHTNIEIKARSTPSQQRDIRELLLLKHAVYKGLDHQIDTYFDVPSGRLKLREGTIENMLIHYAREDKQGPKQAHVILYETKPGSSLKDILLASLPVMVVVDKQREIYFIDNVKFHIDTVRKLGAFMEIEAIDKEGILDKEKLLEQCHEYMGLFRIAQADLISVSYSDLLMKR